jgi:hypothetical protein
MNDCFRKYSLFSVVTLLNQLNGARQICFTSVTDASKAFFSVNLQKEIKLLSLLVHSP